MPDSVTLTKPSASTAPLPAKVVSLQVRPIAVSHLCFDTDGILGDLNFTFGKNGLLGAIVPAFVFDLFYGILGSRPTQPATGSITFTANPLAGTTIVLNGTTWTFVSSAPTGNQLPIGATLAATLVAAVPVLQASADTNTKSFSYSASATVLSLTAVLGGAGGNALTIATTVAGATASGPTLSGGNSSRLFYDFPQIQAAAAPYTLASLRAEPRKAALNKAINARQNAYFAKYGNKNAIVTQANIFYAQSVTDQILVTGNKPARLGTLSAIAESQWTALNGAYANVGRQGDAPGVVGSTVSALISDTASYGYTATSGGTDEVALTGWVNPGTPLPALPTNDPPGPLPPLWGNNWPASLPSNLPQPALPPSNQPTLPQPTLPSAPTPTAANWDSNWAPTIPKQDVPGVSGAEFPFQSLQKSLNYQTTSNQGAAYQAQSITTSDGVFRHPFYEAQARYERAQISLIDQRFAAFMYTQNLPNLGTVFDNELQSIDGDVYQLQVAYLNTILMSPIPGLVTGVYKNPGDAVRAGEPVIRVENYAVILLEASLIFRGPILVGQTTVTVTTSLFGASSQQATTLPGLVVAARGHGDDDQWHVIIQCDNLQPATGSITFTANPLAGTTIVLNGTTWTFVSSSPTGNQLPIGATLASTLAAAVPTLQASADTNTKSFSYSASATVLNLTAVVGGTGGNALTIATTVAGATASGPTLSGGDDNSPIFPLGYHFDYDDTTVTIG